MDPHDPLAGLPLDAADPADAAALADLAAGRVVDSEHIVGWLGGWQMARQADAFVHHPPIADTQPHTKGDAETRPLVWTESAYEACRRLRTDLAALSSDGDLRLVAALVATMVSLIVEGDHPPGFAEVALMPPLYLRIAVTRTRTRIAVLGLRWNGTLS